MMQFQQLFAQLKTRFKSRAPWWVLMSLVQFLALWGQQGLAIIGTFAASIITAWVLASLRGKAWLAKALRLSLLGLIFFPLAGVWIILWELSRMSLAGLLWSWPIFLGMALGYFVLNQASTRVCLQEAGVDTALMKSGNFIRKNLKHYLLLSVFLTGVWIFGFAGGGLGFLLAAPLTFAIFDLDSESILQT